MRNNAIKIFDVAKQKKKTPSKKSYQEEIPSPKTHKKEKP